MKETLHCDTCQQSVIHGEPVPCQTVRADGVVMQGPAQDCPLREHAAPVTLGDEPVAEPVPAEAPRETPAIPPGTVIEPPGGAVGYLADTDTRLSLMLDACETMLERQCLIHGGTQGEMSVTDTVHRMLEIRARLRALRVRDR